MLSFIFTKPALQRVLCFLKYWSHSDARFYFYLWRRSCTYRVTLLLKFIDLPLLEQWSYNMEQITYEVGEWKTSNIQVFWGEIAPCDHVVQVYDNERIFLATLEGFAGTGFLANESVVIIATSNHLHALNERLCHQGFDLESLIAQDKYMPIDAEKLLATFLVDNWIDATIFKNTVTSLVRRAKNGNGKIRAFGEMVAVLWEKGLCGATVQLEHLWNEFHEQSPFTLFCAYPKAGFTQSLHDSMHSICRQHAKVIDGEARPSTAIYYKNAS